jgi:diacylglycerol kinase (ATP)
MPKHALVIFNPATKTQLDSEMWLGRVIEELNRHDTFLVTFYPTTPETRPQDLVPLLKPPLDVVIVAGGDGTVRFALAALAQARSPIPAAILPMGTGNVLARNLGIVEQKFFANPLSHAFEKHRPWALCAHRYGHDEW